MNLIPSLTHTDLQEIKSKLIDGLEEISIKNHPSEHRNHLGISEIGKPCSRFIFYKFRWMILEEHDGRMRRLFARGHREEERYINYLEQIGCKVFRFSQQLWYSEPLNDYKVIEQNADLSGGTGSYLPITNVSYHLARAKAKGIELKQFRISGVMGHYGGSCDGVVITPWYDQLPFLLELKTHNTKSFGYYLDKGLKKAKPVHYDQMCGYGEKLQIKYGIYIPENKNDDDISPEVIELDWQRGKQLELKAQDIILAKEPPAKISDNPAYFDCKYCAASGICHKGEIPLKNCRSCKNSSPTENATWTCSRFGLIPADIIPKGCDGWMPI